MPTPLSSKRLKVTAIDLQRWLDRQIALVAPTPRYVVTKCCGEEDKVTSFDAAEFESDMLDEIYSMGKDPVLTPHSGRGLLDMEEMSGVWPTQSS
jgi:hypothetical protein